jgi:hypothetical protein
MTQAEASRIEFAAEQFRRFSATARADQAPLYENLAGRIAQDEELLELAASARPGQPIAYLFFDAIHFLMLSGSRHALARYYPSVTEDALPAAFVFPVFRDFCVENADQIRALLAVHGNQTNEVGRMAALLPGISEAAKRGGRGPVGLVEVGPSAGLNLCFDRYFFDYGRVAWGDSSSPVRVRCQLEDDNVPPLEAGIPNVAYRIGLDIEPIELTDDNAARWMLSSTWPDHRDLSQMQRNAIEVLRRDPPVLLQGDAVEGLTEVLAGVPRDLTLIVYQSFMIHHLSPERREDFMAMLAQAGEQRPVYFISMYGAGIGAGSRRARVDIHEWKDGNYETRQLSEGHSHGRSLRWMG